MSNKTDLQTHNTDYAALIETLRGKAVGGGGSVETCTVTVINENSNYNPLNVDYLGISNNEMVAIYNEVPYGESITVDVVKNAPVFIYGLNAFQDILTFTGSYIFHSAYMGGDGISPHVFAANGDLEIHAKINPNSPF